MKNATIQNFLVGQFLDTTSDQSIKLASAIRESIQAFKENGGENKNAFSVDAQYEYGEFIAQCDFSENLNMTIMYCEDGDNEAVASLFNLQDEFELCSLAGLMLSEGWVQGFSNC